MEQEADKEDELERDEKATVALDIGSEEKSQGTERRVSANIVVDKLEDSP